MRQAIEEFLRIQTQGLPGEVTYTVGAIAGNNNLTPCAAFEVTLPQGARLWGRGNVVVRCQSEPGWSLFVPVQVRVSGDYFVAARTMAQGQLIADGDLARRHGDLTELPAGVIVDPAQAIGRTAAMSIMAGRPLRGDMLRQVLAVQQGQSVKVVSHGPGFQVANEGRALNSAAPGQVVQVRLATGQVVSGIAQAGGIVEVSY